MSTRRILRIGAVALTAIALASAGYAGLDSFSSSAETSDGGAQPRPDAGGLAELPAGQGLLVRAVDERRPRRDGTVFALTADGETAQAGDLRCKRVAMSADGNGLCLALHENGLDYEAIVFDDGYEPTARSFIEGVPDRARVSPDGRYGGFTSFDRGQAAAYFASGRAFSTYTRILDMRTGEEILRLEDLRVSRAGKPFTTSGAEFWGLTFTGDGRFYATMASRKRHYLIEGTVGEDTAEVVREHVECPSLSPDGRRIAYKRRIGTKTKWRFHVLDLRTGRDTALAETRSIDDQPEWLGDDLVVYSDDKSTFAVPADGTGSPQLLAAQATSPTPTP